MTYYVAMTWDGHTIVRVKGPGNFRNFRCIASFTDAKTANAVCRDLNRHVTQ